MESINTLKFGEKINSPMSAFNNFLLQIGEELSTLYGTNVYGSENCIFNDKSIILFGFIKLLKTKTNNLGIKFLDVIDEVNFKLVQITINNKTLLSSVLFRYLFVLNDITKNYDDSVSEKYVSDILSDLKQNKFDKFWIIPFKNKVCRSLEKNELFSENYEKFTYILGAKPIKNARGGNKNNQKHILQIIKVLSSDLDESKSLENVRFLEKEVVKEICIKPSEYQKFLINLMYYGEF